MAMLVFQLLVFRTVLSRLLYRSMTLGVPHMVGTIFAHPFSQDASVLSLKTLGVTVGVAIGVSEGVP